MQGESLYMSGKKKMTENHFFTERIRLNKNEACLMEPNLSNKKEI